MTKASKKWAILPLDCFSELTGLEIRVLGVLLSHNHNENHIVKLPRKDIAKMIGTKSQSRVTKTLTSLENKGFIHREIKHKKTTWVKLLGKCIAPDTLWLYTVQNGPFEKIDTLCQNVSVQNGPFSEISPDFNITFDTKNRVTEYHTGQKGPFSEISPENNNTSETVTNDVTAQNDPPYKNKKRKEKSKRQKYQCYKVPDKIEKAIREQLPQEKLSKFAEKYNTLDIPDQFDRFIDYHAGRGNPKGWVDWNKAFHRWCKNALEFQAKDLAKLRADEPQYVNGPSEADMQAEQDKKEYEFLVRTINNLPESDYRFCEDIAITELKRDDPKWNMSKPGQKVIFNWKMIEVYKQYYTNSEVK